MPNIERLTELRRVIEAAPEDRLRMKNYSTPTSCGTAYCAAGWAAVDPWFRERGILDAAFQVEDGVDDDGRAAVFVSAQQWSNDMGPTLGSAFGISDAAAVNLFMLDHEGTDREITKAEVLWNIDRLLPGLGTRPYATHAADLDGPGDVESPFVPVPEAAAGA